MDTIRTRSAGYLSSAQARLRRQGRTPAAVMLAFLVGVLFASVAVPHHGAGGGTGQVAALGSTGGAAGAGGAGGAAGSYQAGSPSGGSPTGAAGSGGAGSGTVGSGGAGAGMAAGSASTGAGTSTATGSGAAAAGGGTGTATGKTTAAPAGGNGGATAPGVTGTAIKVGILGADSSALSPACPRCGQGGEATDLAMINGLIAEWHKEGKLPVYGRDIQPVFQVGNDVDSASFQSGCEALGNQHPFVNITAPGSESGTTCFAQQYHQLVVDGLSVPIAQYQAYKPYIWEVGPSLEQILVTFADWANQNGLLKGQVLGLYSPADNPSGYATIQEVLTATFRSEIKKLGYKLAVDYVFNGNGQSDDPVAVQKMRAAGVTVMFSLTATTEPSGFQNQAEQLHYRPKYPVADTGYSYADAVADVTYNANAEDGNKMVATKWKHFVANQPATPSSENPAAVECIKAYQDYTHTQMNVYKDDSKVNYILEECSDMDVILQSIQNAGPNLTQASFIGGIEQIHNMRTAEYWSVSFGPNKIEGSDFYQTAEFNKNRWPPSNDYIVGVGPWQPLSLYS